VDLHPAEESAGYRARLDTALRERITRLEAEP
jgi:hypothetical protein